MINAIRKDVPNTEFLKGVEKFDDDRYSVALESLDDIVDIISIISDMLYFPTNECIRFLFHYKDVKPHMAEINTKKMDRTQNRVFKGITSGYDTFPALRDQFKQIFEDVYKPCSQDVINILNYYPGVKNEAYEFTEKLLRYRDCYIIDDSLKSDVRAIRNSLSHEAFEEDDELLHILLKNNDVLELDQMAMTSMNLSILNKCYFVWSIMPLMNLEVIRKIKGNI